MWNQIRKELKQNRFLIWLPTGMAFIIEGSFLLASWKNDVSGMKTMTALIIFLPCACVTMLAATMMIRRAKEPEGRDTIGRFPAQTAAYFLYSSLAGLVSFICCRIHILRLRTHPETVREMKGILGYLVQFYTGFDTTVTSGTAVLLFALYVLSAFLTISAHELPEAAMRRGNIPRGSRAVIQICVFTAACFAIRVLWSFQAALIVKNLMAFAACAALAALCCCPARRFRPEPRKTWGDEE